MTHYTALAVVAVPILLAIATGSLLLRKALSFPKGLPEEFALAVAWVFLVAAFVWLGAFLCGYPLLGYGFPWNGLAAAHFAFAGYGALTVTALSCRVVSKPACLKLLRVLLVAHPVAYLVTAGGILGYPYCDEAGTTGYAVVFLMQWLAVAMGAPHRMRRGAMVCLLLALAVPLFTMLPALAWGWGRPIFGIPDMIRYHGMVNAIGHVGFGLFAFAWGKPKSHSSACGDFR